MSQIWCDLVASVIDGRLMYRGVVRCEGRAEWKGRWTENKLQACRDADKMAEKIYDLNHNVLTVKRPERSRTIIPGH